MTRNGYMMFCGVGAAVASLSAAALLARSEGTTPLAPISASAHWLWDDPVAPDRAARADTIDTALGAATNIAAGLFWGGFFGFYLHRRPRRPSKVMRDGAVLGAVAGLLDYGLLPRRLSPGWEQVLSRRSVVLSTAAMAGGAVAGGLFAQTMDDRIG